MRCVLFRLTPPVALVWLLFLVPSPVRAATGPALLPPAELSPPAYPAPACIEDVWVISSRGASGTHCEAALHYWRRDAEQCRWIPSSLEEFLATSNPLAPTCFFAHGNRLSSAEAFQSGWQMYRTIAARGCPDQCFRFVIWSWPSDQIHGPLYDSRTKAYRSDAHAYYLAWVLGHLDPLAPVSLIGYSYGSRLVAGALHLQGGGRLAGRALPPREAYPQAAWRAVLMAGGLDTNALAPRGRNGRALTQVEHVLVLFNPLDPVLRWYPMIYPAHDGVEAMGYVGTSGLGGWGPQRFKVQQWNVSRYIGRNHELERYLASPRIMSRVSRYALFADLGER